MPFPVLADGEEHFLIPGPVGGLRLFLRRLPSASLASRPNSGKVVLYVHGATFPSALSIAHRFDGRSWRDALCADGFIVWGLDFLGFGHSERYPAMDEPAHLHPPLCTAEDAAAQLDAAIRFILGHEGRDALSLIAHSWGTAVAGRVAAAQPDLVARLVMFAPIARRDPPRYAARPDGPAWRVITVADQWARFVEDVPADEAPVLSCRDFEAWGRAYLATDPASGARDSAGVKVPSGPFVEILRAWHGELPYDPAQIAAPVAIIRGAWDGLVTDADARWLFDALSSARSKRDVKIGRATHLMHLEERRSALWAESSAFLREEAEGPRGS